MAMMAAVVVLVVLVVAVMVLVMLSRKCDTFEKRVLKAPVLSHTFIRDDDTYATEAIFSS